MLVTARRGELEVADERVRVGLAEGELHLGGPQEGLRYDRLRFETMSMQLDARRQLTEKTRFVSELSMLESHRILAIAKELGPNDAKGRRFEKTFWRRFAVPLMGLVFGVLGAAIALSGSPRSRARAAILGLLCVLGYYILSRIADLAVVKYPGTPLIGAFGPVLILLLVGLIGLARAGGRR